MATKWPLALKRQPALLRLGLPLILSAAIAFSFSGCFLLPKEAEIPALPLVTTGSGSDYRTAAVFRGDLTLTKSISCTYQATKQVNYSFDTGGEYYGSIFVSTGDQVKAGDLLAEMNVDDLTGQIDAAQESIDSYVIQISAARKALELALRTEALNGGGTVASDARRAYVTYLSSCLEIQRLKLSELDDKRDARRLYADIDGTVTYAKTLSDGAATVRGERVVTVTDSSTSVFVANTTMFDYFTTGQEFVVVCDGATYLTQVADPVELGIISEPETGDTHRVCFMITGAEAPASANAKGTVELTLDSRPDALLINNSGIFTIGDESMVYVLNGDGTLSPRQVKTGISSTSYTEILDGLTEGELVIIG